MLAFLLGAHKYRANRQSRPPKRRLEEVALTGWEPVLSGMSRRHGVDPVQFILKQLVRSIVSEDLSWKAVAPDFDLTDLLI